MVLVVATTSVACASTQSMPVVANGSTGATLVRLHDPRTTDHDLFGQSVALEGNTLLVGAPGTDSRAGAAYIYLKGRSGWPSRPTFTLQDPAQGAYFGSTVALSGSTIVVGAPYTRSGTGAAYIYTEGRLGWPTRPTTTLGDPVVRGGDLFGISVAVSGPTVLVGAKRTNASRGAAYLYAERRSHWPARPSVTLEDPVATAGDLFGWSVAVSGTTAMVGAPATDSVRGAAYLYVEGVAGWRATPTITLHDPAATDLDDFGISLALFDGTALVGARHTNVTQGVVYFYAQGASGWPTSPTTTLHDPAAATFDYFGWSVAASGTTAVIGAIGTNAFAGAAYSYVKGSSGWPTTPAVVLDPTARGSGQFGWSVAGDQVTAAVGAPFTGSGAGAAYIASPSA